MFPQETHSLLKKMARSPILEPPEWVEMRAARIADPVERLGFLRRQMHETRERKARPARHWRGALLAAGLAAMMIIISLPQAQPRPSPGEEWFRRKVRRRVLAAACLASGQVGFVGVV